jgi:hypothetical protein
MLTSGLEVGGRYQRVYKQLLFDLPHTIEAEQAQQQETFRGAWRCWYHLGSTSSIISRLMMVVWVVC